MDIEIPEREEARAWLVNQDGSATPLSTYLAEKELSYDDVDDFYDAAHPGGKRPNSKMKAGYTVYRSGGPSRTKK